MKQYRNHAPKYLSALVVCAPFFTVYAEDRKEQLVDRPNILFILSDDHTSQSWGVYGGILAEYAKNENIKRLAAEGCVLDNTFCTNSISVPSRASMLTGAYSHKNGVYTLNNGLDRSHDHIVKQMQMGGYQTALFGKWHLKTKPDGFNDFAVFHDQGSYTNPIFKTPENWVDGKNVGDQVHGFSTDIVTDKTISWIKDRDKDSPFMMCCHFKATHAPHDYPERMEHIYDGVTFPEPENLMVFDWEKAGRTYSGQQMEIMSRRWEAASKQKRSIYPGLPFKREGKSKEADRSQTYQKFIRDFLRCGAVIDENIGRLLDCLEKEGIAENTIVIYVADQGYFLGEHGLFDKRMMLEESLRMPFVIRYPKEIEAGTRNDDMILNIDFAATLADFAGVNAPDLSQGRSFRDNLKGETPTDWRESIYYRYWTHHTERPAHMGVRTKQHKLMFMYNDPLDTKGSQKNSNDPTWEFYDLSTDPKENQNRYEEKAYKAVIKDLKKELLRLRKEVGDTDPNSVRMQQLLEQCL